MGLVSALQVEEEVAGREKQLNTLLQEKKNLKVYTFVHTFTHARDVWYTVSLL